MIAMPFLIEVKKSSEKELSGGFRLSGRGVNLWVRIYQTEFGKRARLTISFFDGVKWINTPPLWIDGELCGKLAERLQSISRMLT